MFSIRSAPTVTRRTVAKPNCPKGAYLWEAPTGQIPVVLEKLALDRCPRVPVPPGNGDPLCSHIHLDKEESSPATCQVFKNKCPVRNNAVRRGFLRRDIIRGLTSIRAGKAAVFEKGPEEDETGPGSD